ncbi:MAG: hypothetical protein SynsKO_39040 [Synoicihabitans sp.]
MTAWLTPILIAWFLVPFVICGVKVVRKALYEHDHDYVGISAVQTKEARRDDPKFARLHADVRNWMIITVIWWFGSFFVLIAYVFFLAWFSQ